MPSDFPVIATIPVDKLVARTKKVEDPLTHILDKWEQDTYSSTTWTPKAYTKMFEKFSYADPANIQEDYFDLWDFATRVVLDEYSYMQNSIIVDPISTEKNMDSTPAFPKFLLYNTEREYLEENGWSEYQHVWNNFENQVPLWWSFLKNETLKVSKILDDDIRMIMCTDPVYTRFGAAFDQHQNSLMKEKTETHYAQVGWSPFYDGLDRRIRRLMAVGDQFVEMDWTRFDGTIPPEVFLHIKELRWFLHADSYKTPMNRKRYLWYVFHLLNKVVLLPSGEVTMIRKGNPSGQISTTTDNNFVNTFLTAFEIAYMYKRENGCLPTLSDFKENVDFLCYGDDRLLAINSEFLKYDASIIPDFYKTIFGMWVKPENVKLFETPEGSSFCGLTVKRASGIWVGVPNVDKILSTFEHPTKRLPNIEALWGKLISLRILVQYAPEDVKDFLEVQICKVEDICRAEGIELPEVPCDFFQKIWTGGPKRYDGDCSET